VPDEVVRGYLAILRRGRRDEGFPALLDRMSPRCDPDEDEALELCNEQLRAFGESGGRLTVKSRSGPSVLVFEAISRGAPLELLVGWYSDLYNLVVVSHQILYELVGACCCRQVSHQDVLL